MAELLPGLSLCFDSGLSSPGLICCLAMSLRYADLLYLWLCAHRLLGQGFRCLLACPLLSSWLWLCRFLWVLFSHMVHNLRDGVTPAGSRLVCPRSERRFVLFFSFPFGLFLRVVTAPRDIVTIWVRCAGRFPLMRDQRLSLLLRPFSFWKGFDLCLRLLFAPCHYWRLSWWPSLRPRVFGCPWLSPVFFPVPCYGYMSASMTLAPGLRLSLVPYPRSFRMGLEPLSEAPRSALQLPTRSHLVVLAEAASLREFLDFLCSSLTERKVTRPHALHLIQSAGCLLCFALYPSGWASPSA